MKRFFQVQFRGIMMAFASRAAYRFDFFTSLLVVFLSVLLTPLTTLLIYRGGASIGEYGFYEMLLINGIFLITGGIAEIAFLGIINNCTYHSREGTLDILFLKPQPLLTVLIAVSFQGEGIGTVAAGILLFSMASAHLPYYGWVNILLCLLMMAASLFVLLGLSVFLSALGIVWVGNSRLGEVFSVVCRFAAYPASIFGKAMYRLVMYAIPLAAAAYLPSEILRGGFHREMLLTAACSLLFFTASLLFWRRMLQHYTGAGG